MLASQAATKKGPDTHASEVPGPKKEEILIPSAAGGGLLSASSDSSRGVPVPWNPRYGGLRPPMRSPSRVRRVLLRAAIFLGVVAIGLELGSRALLRFRGKSWDPAAARSQVEEACRSLSHRVEIKGGHRDETGARESPGSPILHPYLAWAPLATQSQIADDLDGANS